MLDYREKHNSPSDTAFVYGLLNSKANGSRPFYNILNEKDPSGQHSNQNKWSIEMGKNFTDHVILHILG